MWQYTSGQAAYEETQNSLAGLQKWLQGKAMKPANAGVFTDENARNLQVQSTQQSFFYSVWQRQSRLRVFGMVCSLSHNPIAREVKIADLIDNSNLTRLSHVAIGDAIRQYRYNHALQILLRSANNDL